MSLPKFTAEASLLRPGVGLRCTGHIRRKLPALVVPQQDPAVQGSVECAPGWCRYVTSDGYPFCAPCLQERSVYDGWQHALRM
jgi:hypothetical protein